MASNRNQVPSCTNPVATENQTKAEKEKRKKREQASCKQEMLIKGGWSGKIEGKATEPLCVWFRELKGGNTALKATRTLRHTVLASVVLTTL